MTVPARSPVDDALDRLAYNALTVAELEVRDAALATVRSEMERLREEYDKDVRTAMGAAERFREQGIKDAERARRLEDGLREIERLARGWVSGKERLEISRIARALLAGADEPDGGGA